MSILKNIPYKQTHEALREGDIDKLKKLLCSFVIVMAQKIFQYKWEGMEKTDKRNTLKGLVYLDALVTLYRMPSQFEFALGDLSERFRGLPEDVLEVILQKFCKMSLSDRTNPSTFKMSRARLASSDVTTQFKFMKSKESVGNLIMHIIGLVIHLSTGGVAYGHFLSKILKKDIKDLSNYFRELGAYTEIKPRKQKVGDESKGD